ncbi:MAG: phosphopyruvate hydratase [Elusimicrobia bacterium]|nr:phosphopyruvate hydratase [Elusimicrobiota bacterium]
MPKIKRVSAREILDSRGWPTVEAEVLLDDGSLGRAAVPSGASTGEHEAVELRDADKSRYLGKGTLKAASFVSKELHGLLAGKDPGAQEALDDAMIALDGTPNKGRLGANAILAASLAVSRAAAASNKMPLYRYLRKAYGLDEKDWLLPTPMLNVINGGKHADSGLDVQEFMLVPVGLSSFHEALRAGAEIYQTLKKDLAAMKMTVAVGDEGGFAPQLKDHAAALDVLVAAVGKAGYADTVRPALDAAASEFYKNGAYVFEKTKRTAADMDKIYSAWASKYGLVSLEDPLAEDDWSGWKALTASLGGTLRIIGDDIFVTNPKWLERGIRENAANSILIKLNQIGSLSETVRTVLMAQKAGFTCVISHRSGETEDPYIADLAVALNGGAIKTGAPCRSERLAKYNQLLRIESELGAKARYAGAACFSMPAKAGRP